MTSDQRGLALPRRKQLTAVTWSNFAGPPALVAALLSLPVTTRAEFPVEQWAEAYWPAIAGLVALTAIAAVCLHLIRSARRNSRLDEIAAWKTLADSSGEVLILLDEAGSILYMNRSFNGPDTPTGMPVALLFEEIDRPRWEKCLSDVSSHAIACAIATFKVRKIDHADSFWEIRLSSVTEAPLDAAYLCCARDVSGTHRKELTRTILNRISIAAARVDSIEELMEVVVEQLGRVVDTSNCFVALYDADTDTYTRPVYRDTTGDEHSPTSPAELHGGLTDYVRKTGKPLLLTDQNRKDLVELESIKSLGHRAECWLGVPLRVRDEVVGVVVFQSYDNPTLFTERDVELLSIVAGSLGRTVERQRANAELREREARLRVLTERLPALIWTQNLDGTIGYASGAALKQLGIAESGLVGREILDVFASKSMDATKLLDEVTNGRVVSLRLSFGNHIFEAYLEPSLSPAGVIVGAIGVAIDLSEQARKDEELRRYLDISADAYLVLDDEGKLLRCNSAWESLLGYGPGELFGVCQMNLVHPDDMATAKSAMADVSSGLPAIGMEVRIRTRDGSYKWFSFNGKVNHVDGLTYASGKEITYRREIEAALREREEQLRNFVEYSPAPLAMFDRNMNYIVASKRWYQDYKLADESIIGKCHYDVFPDIPDRWKEIHQRCLSGYSESCARDPFPRNDESLDWVRWEIRPWYNSENEVGGIVMLTEVITAEVEAETELMRSRNLARQIVDSSLDAVVAIDGQGFVTEWNPQAEKTFGFTRDEAVGEFIHNLILPERYRDAYRRGLSEFARVGYNSIFGKILNLSAIRNGGEEFPCELVVVPIQVGDETHFAGFIRDLSERVVKDREIEFGRERLRDAERLAGMGSWEWIAADDALYLSEEKLALYERPDLEMPTSLETFLASVHPDDRNTLIETQQKVFADPTIKDFTFEYRVCTPSGRVKHVISQGKINRTADGGVERVHGTTLDISERVLAEQRVRESERRLALAIDASNDAFWDWNLVSGDCYCSAKLVEWFECDPEEFVHRQEFIDSLMLPEDLEIFRKAFEEHAAGLTPNFQVEERYQSLKGNIFWVLSRGKILEWNEDGTPLRAAGTTTNITARKRLEQRATQLGRLLDNSASEVYVIDLATTRIVEANHRALAETGYALEELQAISIDELLRESSSSLVRDAANSLAQGECEAKHVELTLRRKDGTTFPIEAVAQITAWQDAQVLILIGTDITERKAAEREFLELQNQLRHAQRLETIGTLAGGIAHDFNNILTPILGYADMVAHDLPANSPQREDINQVIQAAFRAKSLVQQILTFSRRSEQTYQPLRIDLVVKEALNLLHSTMPRKVDMIKSIHPVGLVMSEPTQMHQVIMNLCTNAFHAMEENGGLLEVRLDEVTLDPDLLPATRGLPEGLYARLIVSDSGVGMDSQTVERIFEPFFTTKDVGQGTGLGLSVVHGIVTAHHGAINIQSEPNGGTEVTVWLPVSQALEVRELSSETPMLGGSEHLLICDDDETIASLTGQMLESFGYSAKVFTDPVDALIALQETAVPFDLVVVDDIMPIFSGRDVAHAVHDYDPDIPVILLSSGTLPGDDLRPFAQVLEKPIASVELAHAVRAALGKKLLMEV